MNEPTDNLTHVCSKTAESVAYLWLLLQVHNGKTALQAGAMVEVYWTLDKEWYTGVIESFDPSTNLASVRYEDGDVEPSLNMSNEQWRLSSQVHTYIGIPFLVPAVAECAAVGVESLCHIHVGFNCRTQSAECMRNVSHFVPEVSGPTEV